MSRSSYIYVVTKEDDTMPVAAFTVKYELVNWYRTRSDIDELWIWRLWDNSPRETIQIDLSEEY